ncbi:hypothetical protein TWF481_001214 [Arthrobotrys musiformis]|uniref:Putative ER transporter 6TM N-terminal domain-containing protein n=1 Tax=Arthrobotrys musiformis TaxID=47236 RepID=A0AAV9WW02_9PEZI
MSAQAPIPNNFNENSKVDDQGGKEAISADTPASVVPGQPEYHDSYEITSKRPSLISRPEDGRDGISEEPSTKQWRIGTVILSKFPTWFTERLTVRDAKILFRASLAIWASFLFVVINPVLQNFGAEAFLGM